VVEPHARASRRIVNQPAFTGAAYAVRNASTPRRRSAALARRQRRFAAAASRLAQAERRSDQSRRRGVEAEVSRWQIHRAITLAKDEDEASRVGPGRPSRRLLGFVRSRRQLGGGLHFCSGRIIGSDLASSRRVGVRAIGDEQGTSPTVGRDLLSLPHGYHEGGAVAGFVREQQFTGAIGVPARCRL